MSIKKYLERTREAKERFSEWNAERRRMSKIRAKERHEEIKERLGRVETIEAKRASIRRLRQKHIPKRKTYPSVQQTSKSLSREPIFGFGNFESQVPQKPILPSYKSKKKNDKGGTNLFEEL